MKRFWNGVVAAMLFVALAAPLLGVRTASADSYMSDSFTGDTLDGSWLSGGNPDSACLTASESATGDIPGCDTETAIDSVGDGALRLTSNLGNQAGFVINQTPVSTANGLQISFDMYQYNGNGADGIAFFLIDGSKNPTQPGAFGGSLGYSNNNTGTAGIVGGYVGVGFDVFGNFSSSSYGTGGPGAAANSITVRGSEATGYKYITKKSATGLLANNGATDRADSKRHVTISISTNNIMTVYVDYEDGNGPIKELGNLDLNTINGAGSLPNSLKFGFSASTGGSNDIHEINGLSVDTLAPSVRATVAQNGTWHQGETGTYTISVKNDPGAEATSGDITVTDAISTPVSVTSMSGDGWTCSLVGGSPHSLRCTHPGSGADALAPGATLPPITVHAAVSNTAPSSVSHNTPVDTLNNTDVLGRDNFAFFNVAAGDLDGVDTASESAAPNSGDANDDGIADSTQANVTSFVSNVSHNYVSLDTNGDCDQNIDPFMIGSTENAKSDSTFSYPIGMMNFSITCDAPGDTTTVTQYYYGDYDAAQYVARKYNSASQTYTDIPGATIENVTIGGEVALKVTYDITDGGPLDADGSANGTIVDPAGPGIKVAAATNQGSTPGVPDTGYGVYHTSPLLTLFAAVGAALFLAGLSRVSAKRYN